MRNIVILFIAFFVALSGAAAVTSNTTTVVKHHRGGLRVAAVLSNQKEKNGKSVITPAPYQIGFIKVPKLDLEVASDALAPLVINSNILNLSRLPDSQDLTTIWVMLLCKPSSIDAIKLILRILFSDNVTPEFSPITPEAYGLIRKLAFSGKDVSADVGSAVLESAALAGAKGTLDAYDLGWSDDSKTNFNVKGKVGRILTFDVWSHRGTGYSWMVDYVETITSNLSIEVFEEVTDSFVFSPSSPRRLGSTLHQRLHVVPKLAGPAKLVLRHVRPWEITHKLQQSVSQQRDGRDVKTVHISVSD